MSKRLFGTWRLAPLAAALALAGIGVGGAFAVGSETTGTVSVCATAVATAATHTVGLDGTGIATTGGDTATNQQCNTTTYTVPTVTQTVTQTVTTNPAPAYLFDDEFNGAAGSQPDPSKWDTFGNTCPTSSNWSQSCLKKANAYQDGVGDLVLEVTPGTQGRAYDGAEISPDFLSGYPPNHSPSSLYEYAPGTHLEARIKFAPGAGLWETFWSVSPDTDSANYLELDTQEYRGAFPNNDTCHTHGISEYGATINEGFDGASGWHTYWQNYYSDHVTWGIDDQTCGTTPIPADPQESFILWNMVGPPSSWGGTGGPPPASDIPADMLVDYVRVSQLP